jgi:hypothetical protein
MCVFRKIAYGIFTMIFLCADANSAEYDSNYYCPRTNIFLEQWPKTGKGRSLFGISIAGINEPFPSSKEYFNNLLNEGSLYIDVQDCSTEQFLCLQLDQNQTAQIGKRFFLFLPKTIEVAQEYKFNDMRLLTQSAGLKKTRRRSSGEVIQAILWQKIDGKEVPIKLTVESRRGVIFIDGLDFWRGRFNGGETCVLQSDTGLFSSVSIKKVALDKSISLE